MKKLTILHAPNLSQTNISETIDALRATAPLPTQWETFGFETATADCQGDIIATITHQKRILPAKVIKREVARVVKKLKDAGDTVSGKREKEIKGEVELELLPKAFIDVTYTRVILSPKTGRVLLETTTNAVIEWLQKALHKAETTTRPFAIDTNMVSKLSNILFDVEDSRMLVQIGRDAVLKRRDGTDTVRLSKMESLNSDEVDALRDSGFVCHSLGIIMQHGMGIINEHGQMTKLQLNVEPDADMISVLIVLHGFCDGLFRTFE